MKYYLNPPWVLRGWEKLPFAVQNSEDKTTVFLSKEAFLILLACTKKYQFNESLLTERQKMMLSDFEDKGIISQIDGEYIVKAQQYYIKYPARFKESVQWSVTGLCNYKCRHCLMSSPEAKMGELDTTQSLLIASQIAECGIPRVSLTGGEPLIRKDLHLIVEYLSKKNITITTVYTNGMLLTDAVLDMFEANGQKPSFQISFDGCGYHDRLRGVIGAQKAAEEAFRLCKKRNYEASAAMCLFKSNIDSIRESVNYLAELGCKSLKINGILEQGEWGKNNPESLNLQSLFDIFIEYIPQLIEDKPNIDVMLGGVFARQAESGRTYIPYERLGTDESESNQILCSHIRNSMYINPEGKVLPCMSMAGTAIEKQFPSIFQSSLKTILAESDYMRLADARLDSYLEYNPDCRECDYRRKCCGGCRASAVGAEGEQFFAPDLKACAFYRDGWYEKVLRYIDQ